MKNMSSRKGTDEGNPKLTGETPVRTDSVGETISVSPPSPFFSLLCTVFILLRFSAALLEKPQPSS
jgi:hypothetical protein